MDPATARVALKLQLDDVDAILKTLPLSPTSEFVAFRSLRDELIRKWQEVSGQAYAYNILREENNSRIAFKRLLSEEQQAERDHDMACRLAGMPVPQRAPSSNKRAAEGEAHNNHTSDVVNEPVSGVKKARVNLDDTQTKMASSGPSILTKRSPGEQLAAGADKKASFPSATTGRQAQDVKDPKSDGPMVALPSNSAAPIKRVAFVDPAILREDEDGRTKRAKSDTPKENSRCDLGGSILASSASQAIPSAISAIQNGTCSSCLDIHRKHDMLQLPCKDEYGQESHAYCRDCLRRLFESSVTDPSHFPPRCCSKIISLFSCLPFLPQPLVARFVARREELGTVNRTYCSNTDCSKWIRPANIEANVARCTECFWKTCTTCKGKQHVGLCPEDKAVKELMNVARQKRWQTCPNCKEMVELERGCYHITCRCRHEFCYLCVSKWKTCKCPAWDERNIVNAVQPIVGQAAAAPAPVANPQPNPAPVQVANLAHNPQPHPLPAPFPNVAPIFANGVLNMPANPALAAFGNPVPAAVPVPVQGQQPHQVQAVNSRKKNRRAQKQKNQQTPHEHYFERYYRSMDWDTECHLCGHRDRWVNCCSECDLKVCWYCTKHRV